MAVEHRDIPIPLHTRLETEFKTLNFDSSMPAPDALVQMVDQSVPGAGLLDELSELVQTQKILYSKVARPDQIKPLNPETLVQAISALKPTDNEAKATELTANAPLAFGLIDAVDAAIASINEQVDKIKNQLAQRQISPRKYFQFLEKLTETVSKPNPEFIDKDSSNALQAFNSARTKYSQNPQNLRAICDQASDITVASLSKDPKAENIQKAKNLLQANADIHPGISRLAKLEMLEEMIKVKLGPILARLESIPAPDTH